MDNPVNVVIVGAGARAIAFCNHIAENPRQATLKAIVDLNIEKARTLNDHYRLGALVQQSYDELLLRNDIDAVMISTPDFAHVAAACAAIEANKHVYLEKPLATTLEDCDKIIEAVSKAKAICYLGFNMRHSPMYERVHQLVVDGVLGKVTTIEANEWYYGGKSYFRRWNRLTKFGGGLWVTKACHDFDILTWISGGMPKFVSACSNLSHYKPIKGAGPRCRDCVMRESCPDYYDINKPVSYWFDEMWRKLQLKMDQAGPMAPDICLFNSDKDTFDNGMVIIEYDNDVRACYTVNVLAARTTRQMRVIGIEAMLEADLEHGTIVLTRRHSSETINYDLSECIKGTHGGGDSNIFTDFFNICRKGGKPRSDVSDGRLAVDIALAARKSSESGSRVELQGI
ncbi:MAG: Gfo/Idh/MocA family protein [Sedimentisphaerales bacterium]